MTYNPGAPHPRRPLAPARPFPGASDPHPPPSLLRSGETSTALDSTTHLRSYRISGQLCRPPSFCRSSQPPHLFRGARLAASYLTFPLLHPCTAAPSCCPHPQARSLDRNCCILPVLLLRRGHCVAYALANNIVSGFVSLNNRDGMLHLASNAPWACSTWLPQHHRQTSPDAIVRTATPPSRNAPPATIRRRTVLQVRPVDASSSCLLFAKRTTVSLLPHPSRSHPLPSAGHHLLLLQAVPHPPTRSGQAVHRRHHSPFTTDSQGRSTMQRRVLVWKARKFYFWHKPTEHRSKKADAPHASSGHRRRSYLFFPRPRALTVEPIHAQL